MYKSKSLMALLTSGFSYNTTVPSFEGSLSLSSTAAVVQCSLQKPILVCYGPERCNAFIVLSSAAPQQQQHSHYISNRYVFI